MMMKGAIASVFAVGDRSSRVSSSNAGDCFQVSGEVSTRPRSRSLVGPNSIQFSQMDGGAVTLSAAAAVSERYKTELCRSYAETGGNCRYGDRCQFAHGPGELRSIERHPRYKTELCRTFHSRGFCAYGPRCHFIHNVDETRLPPTKILEQMMVQRQMMDVMILGQLSPSAVAQSTATTHRRLSLDVPSTNCSCVPSISRNPTNATVSIPSSWSSCQIYLDQLLSSQGASTSEAELFRTRSMSLGSAASRSIDCSSASSSPGPSSPSAGVVGTNGHSWPGIPGSFVTDDGRSWYDSPSMSVPDSPTLFVGGTPSDASLYESRNMGAASVSNAMAPSDGLSAAYVELREKILLEAMAMNHVTGCNIASRRMQMWPTC